tara:strand:+ start:828 stop:1040 length:213 start_codon:yes stop_codon:yes gene_type:complete
MLTLGGTTHKSLSCHHGSIDGERVERDLLYDNCHKERVHVRIVDIVLYRQYRVPCGSCLVELKGLLEKAD